MDYKKHFSEKLVLYNKDTIIKPVISEEENITYFTNNNSYIEYFIEVGINPYSLFMLNISQLNSIETMKGILNPEIISKFPNIDKKYVLIDKASVKTIFPKGIKITEVKNTPDPEFYSVILDNQQCSNNYLQKYISCLVIYEKLSNYISLYYDFNEIEVKNNEKKILDMYDKYYIPKCLAIVSLYPYIDKYEEILRSIYEIFLSENSKYFFLEELIMKLVIEIPKVPNGISNVYVKFPNKTIELTEKKMNELPAIHFNLSQAIGHFSLSNFIDIYTYLLLETKMIFFSSKIQELSNTILSFLFLLSPLKYQFQIVSNLPRELFHFCKSLSPFIFGINESYYQHFFKKNKIEIEDSTICVVDIDDGNYYMIAPDGELDEKQYPDMPSVLREKLENKLNGYYQKLINDSFIKNHVRDDNKKYQKIFYKFMIYLYKDYPKYLMDDYGINKSLKLNINYIIDLEKYIKSKAPNERIFYNKILNTQMFIEFIYKRMMPKNCGEKVEALFFEEKIYEKKSRMSIFNKYYPSDQSFLLSSTEYDYKKKNLEIIDLSKITKNSKEITNYFIESKKEIIFDIDCLSKGFFIEKNKNNKLKYTYHLFPLLINEKIFKINKKNFHIAKRLYKDIEKINARIVNRIHFKQENRKIKNTEIENDNYLSYLIVWSLTFWYTDKEEREFRYNQMIEILEKIEEHEIEICEILMESVAKYGTENNIRLLYKKFIERKLNPSWKIFNLVSKYLKNNKKHCIPISKSQNHFFKTTKKNFEMSKSKSNRNLKNDNYNNRQIDLSMFRLRTLKNLDIDENIISEDVEFLAYSQCRYCKKTINLAELCSNLSAIQFKTDINTGVDKLKCPNKTKDRKNCDRHSEQKINFQYGVELFNQDIENQSTCRYLFVPLLSPTTIKKKLLSIVHKLPKDTNFNVELFKKNHTNVFWNCLWYFQLNNMEISFMLPYADNKNKKMNFHKLFDFKMDINRNKIILNPNNIDNKFEIYKKLYNKYKDEDLCKQIIFQFSIIKEKGYVSYINPDTYLGNIGYNELPLYFKVKNYIENKEPQKGIRASFWFSSLNRIIDKPIEVRHTKNKTEVDLNKLIKEFDFNDSDEEDNDNKKKYEKINRDIKKKETNYINVKNLSRYNNTFKKRGTLTKGLFTDGNLSKNEPLDFE